MDLSWKLVGACRFASTDLFYPASDAESGSAKAACESCHVKERCLEYALEGQEPDGVWGGRTFAERRTILRHRRGRVKEPVSA